MKSLRKDDSLLPHIRPQTKYRLRKYLYIATITLAIFFLYRHLNSSRSDDNLKKWNYQAGRDGQNVIPAPREDVNPKPIEIEPSPPAMVKVEVFMEAQCPDTTRFFRQQLKKAWQLLSTSQRVDLSITAFGKARCVEHGNDFKCECQHGPNECEINQLMNCVMDRYVFAHRYVPAVLCMQGKPNLYAAMLCVQELMPAEAERMRACASGERGRRLLALAGQKTAALNPPIDFIPWIVINGERNGDALYDLTQNICEAMEKPLTPSCVAYLDSLKKSV